MTQPVPRRVDSARPDVRQSAGPLTAAQPTADAGLSSLPNAAELLKRRYHDLRWHILSLAAEFDRIQRAEGGEVMLSTDPRLLELRACLHELLDERPDRAQRVQMLLSDRSPPPVDVPTGSLTVSP